MSDSEYRGRALDALGRLLTADQALRIYQDVLREVPLAGITTPTDLARFARRLQARGGALAIVGGSLEAYATIKGATRVNWD